MHVLTCQQWCENCQPLCWLQRSHELYMHHKVYLLIPHLVFMVQKIAKITLLLFFLSLKLWHIVFWESCRQQIRQSFWWNENSYSKHSNLEQSYMYLLHLAAKKKWFINYIIRVHRILNLLKHRFSLLTFWACRWVSHL